ncbi:MAG: PAS domain-containing protein [Acidimicrobiales bacterium]
MEEGRQGEAKDVVLILARELATNIATPMMILDARGTLVFYNEPAEVILGHPFSSVGELAPEAWSSHWHTEDLEGNPVSVLDSPLARVITERTPVHSAFAVRGGDGVLRAIQATAYPLFARADRFVGAVAVFWENGMGA